MGDCGMVFHQEGDSMTRCSWPGGCRVVLREGNKVGLCGVHQKQVAEKKMRREENLAVRSGLGEGESRKRIPKRPLHVREVLRATDFFFGFLDKREEDGVPFAREVAVFLLKTDFSMCSKYIARDLDLECHVVERSYNNVRSMVETSPEFRRNLEQVRTQYKHESPA